MWDEILIVFRKFELDTVFFLLSIHDTVFCEKKKSRGESARPFSVHPSVYGDDDDNEDEDA